MQQPPRVQLKQMPQNKENLTAQQITALDEYFPATIVNGIVMRIGSEKGMAKMILKMQELESKINAIAMPFGNMPVESQLPEETRLMHQNEEENQHGEQELGEKTEREIGGTRQQPEEGQGQPLEGNQEPS